MIHRSLLAEQNLCGWCGRPYGIRGEDCKIGDCKEPAFSRGLRPGRDQHGRYYPAAEAFEYRQEATRLRAKALEWEKAADKLTPLGSVMFLPEVVPWSD